jgi:hypothetical protein
MLHAPDTGQVTWALTYGGPGDDRPYALALTDSSALVAGWFQGSADFGGTKLSSNNGSRDGVLIGLDLASGATQFGTTWGGPLEDAVTRVAAGVEGRIGVGGYFEGVLPGVDADLRTAGGMDAFVALLNSDHPSLWTGHRYGGSGNDQVGALAWSAVDELVFGGQFEIGVDVAQPPFASVGGADTFFACVKPFEFGK